MAAEGGNQDFSHLIIIARNLEFLGGAADGHVVYEDLRLVERAVGNASQFAKFQITEMLNTDPDSDPQDGEHKTQGAACRPQQEQAQHGKSCRNAVEDDHDLAVRHAVLQELVVDVLTVGGEDGPAADQTADDRERRLQNR